MVFFCSKLYAIDCQEFTKDFQQLKISESLGVFLIFLKSCLETVVKIGTRVARGGFIPSSQLVVKEFDRYATFLNQGWEGMSRINAN